MYILSDQCLASSRFGEVIFVGVDRNELQCPLNHHLAEVLHDVGTVLHKLYFLPIAVEELSMFFDLSLLTTLVQKF